MPEQLSLTSVSPQDTAKIAGSLSKSLYAFPCDILLHGPLGAGKTVFVKGLAHELGISEDIVSPTFALENRFETKQGYPFFHLDLYRLTPLQAEQLLMQTDVHEGVRVIEWPEKAARKQCFPSIEVTLSEERDERRIAIEWNDVAIPTEKEIVQWRKDVLLQPHISEHCDTVAAVAVALADYLIERNIIVRRELLNAAGRLHDLFRFIDFGNGGGPVDVHETTMQQARWNELREEFSGMQHEPACALFLRQKHYPAVAHIVETHGVRFAPDQTATVEQQLLYYADKRCIGTNIVCVDERFDDFRRRYGDSRRAEAQVWQMKAKEIEKSLFPSGVPSLG